MPKGENFSWATDDNFPAGSDPWSDQPNKLEPSAGMQSEGWHISEPISAQHENWKFHQLANTNEWLSSIQLVNWWNADMSWVDENTLGNPTQASPWGNSEGATEVCFDESNGVFSAVDYQGRVIISREVVSSPSFPSIPGGDGSAWDDSNDPFNDLGWTSAPWFSKISTDNNGRRIVTYPNFDSQIAIATSVGAAWTLPSTLAGATPPVYWYGSAHDHNNPGTWCICGSHSGGGSNLGIIEYSINSGVTWINAVSLLNEFFYEIAHNHLPGSAGYFLAFTGINVFRSADGINWSNLGPHSIPFGTLIMHLEYIPGKNRWIVMYNDIPTNSEMKFKYSDDDGANWSDLNIPPLNSWHASLPAYGSFFDGLKYFSMKSDNGNGILINGAATTATGSSAIRGILIGSHDGGDNWYEIEHPELDGPIYGALGYGHNRFVLVGKEKSIMSLRLPE